MRIAVAGANSSVGVNLLRHVADSDDVTCAAVVRSERAADSLPQSPRISRCVVSYEDSSDLAAAFDGASSVVHLAGILIESRTSRYERANVGTAAAVVAGCRAAGVGHLVLVSVLGADSASSNRYLRSKGEAERLFAESGLAVSILRTPILLGPDTAGARGLIRAVEQRKARVLGGGSYTMRPLDLDDLSRAILRTCRAPPTGVVIHELVGPEALSYRDLIARLAERLGEQVRIESTPVWAAKLGAAIMYRLRRGGMSPTVIDVITAGEAVEKNADEDLGISLTPLSATLDKIVSERTGAT